MKNIKTLSDITKNIDMILFNWIIQVEEYLIPEVERELNEENWEEYIEYYQYYAVNRSDWEYLASIAPDYFSLFYSEKCDIFILWVQFLDNWSNIEITL